MSACSCDGPPHQYDPSWCGRGRFRPERGNSCPPTETGFVLRPTRATAHRADIRREAEAWAKECDDNAHWARTRTDRATYQNRARILRGLLADVEIARQEI